MSLILFVIKISIILKRDKTSLILPRHYPLIRNLIVLVVKYLLTDPCLPIFLHQIIQILHVTNTESLSFDENLTVSVTILISPLYLINLKSLRSKRYCYRISHLLTPFPYLWTAQTFDDPFDRLFHYFQQEHPHAASFPEGKVLGQSLRDYQELVRTCKHYCYLMMKKSRSYKSSLKISHFHHYQRHTSLSDLEWQRDLNLALQAIYESMSQEVQKLKSCWYCKKQYLLKIMSYWSHHS